MTKITDASHLYATEFQQRHAERPGFRINELRLGKGQAVPWHKHSEIQDTFYVLQGKLEISLREPEAQVVLSPGEVHTVAAGRPHFVTTANDQSVSFLVLQGIGEYDYIPLD